MTSGKGGVGKTSVAVNLAIRLSTMGRKTLLLDADLGTANADVLCNLSPSLNIAHVVAGRAALEKVIIDAPGGFRLIPGASGLAQIAALGQYERDRLIAQMLPIESEADTLIIDTGAGVSPNVLSFALSADQLLVVTTPEPTAVTDAYALIKLIARQKNDADIRVLVNMVRDLEEARQVFDRLDAVAKKFLGITLRFAGHLVHDTRVGLAVRKRCPFVIDSPRCEASLCIGQLAHRLDRHAHETGQESLLRRMTAWLSR